MRQPLGIALVGTGFGQKVHLPAFRANPFTQVVAVYHRDLAKAITIAKANDIPFASDDLTEVVNLPEVHAASISSPPFLHYDMAKTVLTAGKHLLLEKPTTLNAREALDLYQLAQERGAIVAMDFEFRYLPEWQRLAELMAENYVGHRRLIKIDWLGSSRADAKRAWNWYAQKEKGGGTLGSLGSHTFDYIAWLFGPVQRLCAHLSTTVLERPDPVTGRNKPVDSDDHCTLWLELVDGTSCQVCISSVTHQGRGHWVEIYGDQGSIVLGNSSQKDYIYGFQLLATPHGKPNESLIELEISDRLKFKNLYTDGRISAVERVIEAWVEGIDQGRAIAPSLREGVYSQILMDLTHQSHEQKTWLEVPDLTTFLAG